MFVNSLTLEIPLKTLHYMNQLTDILDDNYLHLHCIPVMFMVQLITGEILKSDPMLAISLMKMAKLYEKLHIHSTLSKLLKIIISLTKCRRSC